MLASIDTHSIVTVLFALIGAGIGWGAMRAGHTDLKQSVEELKKGIGQLTLMTSDVMLLKSDSLRHEAELKKLQDAHVALELKVARRRK